MSKKVTIKDSAAIAREFFNKLDGTEAAVGLSIISVLHLAVLRSLEVDLEQAREYLDKHKSMILDALSEGGVE